MNKATILVVDDDPQVRRVLQATLSSNGYDVIEAKIVRTLLERIIERR